MTVPNPRRGPPRKKLRIALDIRGDVEKLLREVAAGKTATNQKTGTYGRAIVTGGKGTANKAVTLLGAIGTFAVDRGFRPDNPAKGVKLYKSRSSERFLSADELSRLGEALCTLEERGLVRRGSDGWTLPAEPHDSQLSLAD